MKKVETRAAGRIRWWAGRVAKKKNRALRFGCDGGIGNSGEAFFLAVCLPRRPQNGRSKESDEKFNAGKI